MEEKMVNFQEKIVLNGRENGKFPRENRSVYIHKPDGDSDDEKQIKY